MITLDHLCTKFQRVILNSLFTKEFIEFFYPTCIIQIRGLTCLKSNYPMHGEKKL